MISIFLVLFLQNLVFGQINLDLKKLRKIELLASTRKDVKKTFTEFKSKLTGFVERFYTKDAEIEISYSAGRCMDINGRWDVPKWVVIEIYLTPKINVTPRRLGLDPSQFYETEISDIEGGKMHTNDVEGVEFTTSYGRLTELRFYPSEKFKSLSCGKINPY